MKYEISTLLTLHQDIDASRCKWTSNAKDCGLLSPGQRRKLILCESPRNRPAQGTAKSSRLCRNTTSKAKSRGRHSPSVKPLPPKPIVTSDEGFTRFLQEHSSPRHQRVTAGGRIVPMEPPGNPPQDEVLANWPSEGLPAVVDIFEDVQPANENVQATTSGQFAGVDDSGVDLQDITFSPQQPGWNANGYSINEINTSMLTLPAPNLAIPPAGVSLTIFGPSATPRIPGVPLQGQFYTVLLVPGGVETSINAAQTLGAIPGPLLSSDSGDASGPWMVPASPLNWTQIHGDSESAAIRHDLATTPLAVDVPWFLLENILAIMGPNALWRFMRRFKEDLIICEMSLNRLNREMALDPSSVSDPTNVWRRMTLSRHRARCVAIVEWLEHRVSRINWFANLHTTNPQWMAPSGLGPNIVFSSHVPGPQYVQANGLFPQPSGMNPEAPNFPDPSNQTLGQNEMPAAFPDGDQLSTDSEASFEAFDNADIPILDLESKGVTVNQSGEPDHAHINGLFAFSGSPLPNIPESAGPGSDAANRSEAGEDDAYEIIIESGENQIGETMDGVLHQSFSDHGLDNEYDSTSMNACSSPQLRIGECPDLGLGNPNPLGVGPSREQVFGSGSQILTYLFGQGVDPAHTASPIVETTLLNAYASPGSWAREASRMGGEH